jgi:heat shock protein HslJ
MKRIISGILVVCAVACIIAFSGCKKDKKEETGPALTMEQKLSGKWTLKTVTNTTDMFGNKNTRTDTYTAGDYFEFNSNGTVNIVEGSNTYNGKWKIENNKLYFSDTNYIDYTTGFTVPVISSNELQLYYVESNTFQTTEQKFVLSR